MLVLYVLVPACVALAACAFGRIDRGNPRAPVKEVFAAACAVVMVLVAKLVLSVPNAHPLDAKVVIGLAIAVVGLGLLPMAAFFVIGRMAEKGWVAGTFTLLGLVPLSALLLTGAFLISPLVSCEPGVHEC